MYLRPLRVTQGGERVVDVSPEDSMNRGKTPSILLLRVTNCTRFQLEDRYELIVAGSAASLGVLIACTT